MATKNSSSSTSTGTTPDESAQPEIPEQPAETTPDTAATNGADSGPTGVIGATGGQEEPVEPDAAPTDTDKPEAPADPVVVNDDNGQHVDMPDGSVVVTRQHTLPISNEEQEKYDVTHTGDQLRYLLVPGDAGYSPYSDPAVPDSHLAQRIEREILSFAERVLENSKAVVSPMWNGLKGIFTEELDKAIATGETSGKVSV
jgi:hypothetical protein